MNQTTFNIFNSGEVHTDAHQANAYKGIVKKCCITTVFLLAVAIILCIAESHCNAFWQHHIEPYFPHKIVIITAGTLAIVLMMAIFLRNQTINLSHEEKLHLARMRHQQSEEEFDKAFKDLGIIVIDEDSTNVEEALKQKTSHQILVTTYQAAMIEAMKMIPPVPKDKIEALQQKGSQVKDLYREVLRLEGNL